MSSEGPRCRRCGEPYDCGTCGCPTLILVTEGEGDVKFWQHKDHGPHRFGHVEYPDGTGDNVILVHGEPTWFAAGWEWVEAPDAPQALLGKAARPAGGAPRYVVTDITLEGCGTDPEGE